jgi:Xaa-Pro dipeptidase
MSRADEIGAKLARVHDFMSERGLAGVLLGTQANFAWITAGGDNHVGLSSEGGVAAVLVTRDDRYVLTTNIEGERIACEEIADLGFRLHAEPWHRAAPAEQARRLAGSGEVAADHDAAGSWRR